MAGDRAQRAQGEAQPARWTFLTNHGFVLLAIAVDPDARMRDIATDVGITERAVQRIVSDLIREGYVSSQRVGRRNRYVVNRDRPLRHRSTQRHRVSDLLAVLVD